METLVTEMSIALHKTDISDLTQYMTGLGQAARAAAAELAYAEPQQKNQALLEIAAVLDQRRDFILEENQRDMAAASENALSSAMLERLELTPARIEAMIEGLQQVASPMSAALYVDVGHNPDAARVLAASLARIKPAGGELVLLLGMLEDKNPAQFVEALKPVVDRWWLTSLDCDRGLDAAALKDRIGAVADIEKCFDNPSAALDHALSSLGNQDIMLVTGSFVTAELLLRASSVSG